MKIGTYRVACRAEGFARWRSHSVTRWRSFHVRSSNDTEPVSSCCPADGRLYGSCPRYISVASLPLLRCLINTQQTFARNLTTVFTARRRASAVYVCCRRVPVHPSQVGVLSKRLNIESWTIANGLCEVSQKHYTWPLIITSTNVDRFPKFFHCQIPEEILCTHIIKIVHLTLSTLLHYLVKLENYNCCRFQ